MFAAGVYFSRVLTWRLPSTFIPFHLHTVSAFGLHGGRYKTYHSIALSHFLYLWRQSVDLVLLCHGTPATILLITE